MTCVYNVVWHTCHAQTQSAIFENCQMGTEFGIPLEFSLN